MLPMSLRRLVDDEPAQRMKEDPAGWNMFKIGYMPAAAIKSCTRILASAIFEGAGRRAILRGEHDHANLPIFCNIAGHRRG
jgi:hypothetical protein